MSRRALALFAALLVLALSGAAGAVQPAPVRGRSLVLATEHAGLLRDFRLYVAGRVPTTEPVPLLIVLHGLNNEPQGVEAASGFDGVAETEDVALLYPAGWQHSWNAGRCCGSSAAAGVDDVGLLVHLVTMASMIRPIDLRRVYVAGFSNGGMMALRAICERPDVFAGAVSVGGTLITPCPSGSPVSALLVHGALDATVPLDGERYSSYLHTSLPAVPLSAAILARRSGCRSSRVTLGEGYRQTSYVGCAAGSSVELVVADELGHSWPVSRQGVDAERLAWQFLTAHHR